MRFETLRDFDFEGLDVRVWCLRCARGQVADGAIWEVFLGRGWPIDLARAPERFRCVECRRTDAILIVPARRVSIPPRDWAAEVVGYFHATRARRKRAKRGF
ncbi:hypothetical protein [Sphingomonas hankookensis]|uniref:hypothetical protein n=1 Tax=Sphingomonas hankookensis TaxID=563996 RepID=UPI003D303069